MNCCRIAGCLIPQPEKQGGFAGRLLTNAFTESFNAKVRRVYRNGHGYTFERLRAKVLFTDRLQKRIPLQEKVKVKKQRFEDISMGRMTYFMMSGTFDDDYEVKTKTRMANAGADLPTLLAWLDSDDF